MYDCLWILARSILIQPRALVELDISSAMKKADLWICEEQ